MSKLHMPYIILLLLMTSPSKAENDSSDDLRYCLELQSNYEIAKCSGEISAGNKGKPYSKEKVDKILSEQQARPPASPVNSSDMPSVENQIKDVLLEQDDGNSR